MKKNMRAVLRGAVFLPVLPLVFRVWVAALRLLGVLPRVRKATGEPRRILVVNLTPNVGDTIMMLPFLDKLHETYPEAALQVAVARPIGSLLRSIAYLERVHELEPERKLPPVMDHYVCVAGITRYAIRNLRNTSYDMCLMPRWGTDPLGSAFLAYLTDAPIRCGQDPREEHGAGERLPGTRFLMTQVIRGGHGLPEAVRELRLLPECGLSGPIDEHAAERQTIASLLAIAHTAGTPQLWERLGLDPDAPFAVISPGANAAFRRWPLERFAETARLLREQYGFTFVAMGAPAERHLGETLEAISGGAIRSLAGMTTLPETVAVFSRAKLFLGNDSGPAHIAGGLGVHTLVLSVWPQSNQMEGPSSPLRVRPAGPYVQVVRPHVCAPPCAPYCSAAEAHCILDIQSGDLLAPVRAWFEDAPRAK